MVLDSLHLQGRRKGWSAMKGKDVDRRSVAYERASQLHGPQYMQSGPVTTRPGPMVFKIIEPGPAHAGLYCIHVTSITTGQWFTLA